MTKLYVICGHGAGDPGAVGGGKTEADLVRKLAARMKALGGSNVEVLDTSRNWYADGGINSALKSKVGNNPLLELHMDSASASAKGAHVIINGNYAADEYDKKLASALASLLPGRAQSIVGRTDLANPNRAANAGINYRLAEVGFITHDGDRSKVANETDTVARCILNAFGIASGAGWVQDSKGWWYRRSDGSYPKSQWLELDAWYWFDADGYAACFSWREINGKQYFFDANCRMLHSCVVHWGNEDYVLGADGAMIEGSVPLNPNGSIRY